jgi:hypothetical protein
VFTFVPFLLIPIRCFLFHEILFYFVFYILFFLLFHSFIFSYFPLSFFFLILPLIIDSNQSFFHFPLIPYSLFFLFCQIQMKVEFYWKKNYQKIVIFSFSLFISSITIIHYCYFFAFCHFCSLWFSSFSSLLFLFLFCIIFSFLELKICKLKIKEIRMRNRE